MLITFIIQSFFRQKNKHFLIKLTHYINSLESEKNKSPMKKYAYKLVFI